MPTPDPPESPATPSAPARSGLEARAGLLIGLFIVLVLGTVLYLMYARGSFEATQRLVLVADDSEGVRVGMDLTFSGFPIGRVRRIELAPDGTARIVVDVPRRDAHWLRETSVFTLVRSLVGGATLKAYSGVLTDPPLPDGAERRVLLGDATAELPRLVSDARALIQNLTQLSSPDAPLAGSLADLKATTERLRGPQGAMGVLLGNDTDARRPAAALAQLQGLLARLDGLTARADAQLLGPDGVLPQGRAGLAQLTALLGEARQTLQRVDALLAQAQAIAADAKAVSADAKAVASEVRNASTDLGALRAEVDATLRKVEQLVDEVNRKWPFARDTELRLR